MVEITNTMSEPKPAVPAQPAYVLTRDVLVDGYRVSWFPDGFCMHGWAPNYEVWKSAHFRKLAAILYEIADALDQEKANV